MFPEGRALEFLLAAVVALVVVGPKDLPILLRKLGRFVAKMRAMAAEFRASFDEMARQSELDELRKEVEAMRKAQFADVATQADAVEASDAFDSSGGELGHAGEQSAIPPYHPDALQTQPLPEASPQPAAKRAPRRKSAAAAAKAAPKRGKTSASRARKAAPRKAAARPRAKTKPEAEA